MKCTFVDMARSGDWELPPEQPRRTLRKKDRNRVTLISGRSQPRSGELVNCSVVWSHRSPTYSEGDQLPLGEARRAQYRHLR